MKPITDTLREINNGKFVEEITAEFAELVRNAMATGKKGKLAVQLTIKPARGGRTMTLDADYKASVPEYDRPTEHFFVDNNGSLLRNDPNQPQLDLRSVTVDVSTGEIRAAVAG